MHMADALLSPAVGGGLWVAAAGLTAYAARGVSRETEARQSPLMGVLGAFVFAAQMINFAIPGTGSSGHLGGGLLLAVLLGSHAGFIVMAAILTAQALLFADGGLLALGANLVNLGFFTCFVAYPLIYLPIARRGSSPRRTLVAAVAASVVGLQLGSLGVVLETSLSGISRLPVLPFLAFMQPIHLAIGLVEGIVTAAVLLTLSRARPDLARPGDEHGAQRSLGGGASRRVALALTVAAVLVAGGLSTLASNHPDGLEWALERVGFAEASDGAPGPTHRRLAELQSRTSLFPDYATPSAEPEGVSVEPTVAPAAVSLPGLFGVAATLLIAGSLGVLLRRLRPPARPDPGAKP